MKVKRLPPLNALRVFESAARHLSFTRAADELFVTQAAVSHQIKSLEEFLGIKLFLRRNRTLLLTEEGQSYFLDMRDVFLNIQDATERLLARGAKGAITVATLPSFASQWLVPRLNDFNMKHPDIDVMLKAVDMEEGDLTDDVDVAIFYGKGYGPGLHVDRLFTEYLAPICSPLLLESGKPLNSMEDLKYHTLLHDQFRDGWKTWVKRFGLKQVEVNSGPIFSHTMLVLQAAALGQGIALGHTLLARPEIAAGRLIYPFEEKLESKHSYYLVCQQAQAELGKIVAFREWLMSKVHEEGL